jgi:hypothetical protein
MNRLLRHAAGQYPCVDRACPVSAGILPGSSLAGGIQANITSEMLPSPAIFQG